MYDAPRDVLLARRGAQSLEDDILESVVRESWFVSLNLSAGRDEAVRLELRTRGADALRGRIAEVAVNAPRRVPGIRAAETSPEGVKSVGRRRPGRREVLVCALVVADHQHVALLLPTHVHPDPSREVLGELHHIRAVRKCMDRLRRNRALHLRARTVLRDERTLRRGHLGGAYLAFREVGSCGMVRANHLAFADAIVADGTFHLTPRTVRDDRLARAVRISDLKLRNHAREVAPRRNVEVPHCDGTHVVPAVSHQHLQRILARLQRATKIVCGVEDALVVSRGRRIQYLVADLASVERRLVEADARDVKNGRGDRLCDCELLLERGRGDLLARDKRLAIRRIAQGAKILAASSIRHDAAAIGKTHRTDECLRDAFRAFLHPDGHRVLAHLQPRRHVAETQMIPAVYLSGMAVELMSVHVDLVPCRRGVQQLHVLAGFRAGEVEVHVNHHVALGVGLVDYPSRAPQIGVWTRLGRGPDPLRLPTIARHDASRPLGRRAPGALRASAVPRAYLPPVTPRRGERLSAIRHVDRVRPRHLAGVPYVARVRRKFLLRACHQNTICALYAPLLVLARRNLPAEARRRDVHAARILPSLHCKPVRPATWRVKHGIVESRGQGVLLLLGHGDDRTVADALRQT